MSSRYRRTRASSRARDPRSRIDWQRAASVRVADATIDATRQLMATSSTTGGASGVAPFERSCTRRQSSDGGRGAPGCAGGKRA
eukprot:12507462-Alexandrium_andersonii.AAC.1